MTCFSDVTLVKMRKGGKKGERRRVHVLSLAAYFARYKSWLDPYNNLILTHLIVI